MLVGSYSGCGLVYFHRNIIWAGHAKSEGFHEVTIVTQKSPSQCSKACGRGQCAMQLAVDPC